MIMFFLVIFSFYFLCWFISHIKSKKRTSMTTTSTKNRSDHRLFMSIIVILFIMMCYEVKRRWYIKICLKKSNCAIGKKINGNVFVLTFLSYGYHSKNIQDSTSGYKSEKRRKRKNLQTCDTVSWIPKIIDPTHPFQTVALQFLRVKISLEHHPHL